MKKSCIIFIVILMSILLIIVVNIYRFLSRPLMSDKSETNIYIDDGDIIDGEAMMNPPEKYSQLLSIDEKVRKKLGNYMIENNLRLEFGKQSFFSFLSYKEMMELQLFKFTDID